MVSPGRDVAPSRRTGARVLFSALLVASCSGSSSTSTTGSTPPSHASTAGSSPPSTTAPAANHDIASLPSNLTASDDFADLTDTSTKNADPQLVDLANKVRQQLGGAVDGAPTLPSTPAYGGLVRRRSGVVDFLILDLLVAGAVFPSQSGAEALSSMSERVGHTVGLDAPDGPESDHQKEEAPFDSSNAAGSMTGNFSTDISVNAEHSLVKVDLGRTMQATLSKDATQTALGVDIHNVESVDFCPDAAGIVPVDVQSDVSITGGTTTIQFQIVGHFLGSVNDNADLTNVTGSATVTGVKIVDGTSQDPYSIDMTGLNFPVDSTGVGPANGGTWQSNAPSAALGGKVAAVAWDLENSLKTIYARAQSLWQHSSCVTVQIPDFDVYGDWLPPKDVDFQRDVAPASTTKFTTQVHHRFEHTNANLPVVQKLPGKVRLDPPTLSSTPGKSTYEAPNNVDESYDATFETRSRRGRSLLKGRFSTTEKPPTIGISGTITTTEGPATLTGPVTMSPILFSNPRLRDAGGTEYYVDAPVTAGLTLSIAGMSVPCKEYSHEEGTIRLVAHSEPRGDKDRVWVIQPDPGQSHFDATITCVVTVGAQYSKGGGETAKFFAALGDFEIPVDPATTNLDKQRTIPGGNDHSQAAVTLVAPPP